jgi:hypothetical protein
MAKLSKSRNASVLCDLVLRAMNPASRIVLVEPDDLRQNAGNLDTQPERTKNILRATYALFEGVIFESHANPTHLGTDDKVCGS